MSQRNDGMIAVRGGSSRALSPRSVPVAGPPGPVPYRELSSGALPFFRACRHAGVAPWTRPVPWQTGEVHAGALPACSLVWLRDPPKPAEMHLHYTAAYHKLISAAGETSPVRWEDRKAALTPYKQSGALLDLGCSSGSFLEFMGSESWKLYGVEMSAESARTAEERSKAQVFVGDILDAPFPRESFDVITCFDVLEHLYEPRRVMARVGEWLKPGGIFYVLVPNVNSAEARVFGSYWHGLELPRHLFHYTPASLKFLAESAGLRECVARNTAESRRGD